MKKPEIIIHVGMNETGSSIIQQWMSENYENLKKQGILYPKSGRKGIAHHELSSMFGFKSESNNKVSLNRINNFSKAFEKELSLSNFKTVIFSSEEFLVDIPLDELANFFSLFECKILIYLRRHDFWWEASYRSYLKHIKDNQRAYLDIESFISDKKQNKRFFNYKLILEKWSDTFGKSNVIVRPIEEDNISNIESDLAGVLDCDYSVCHQHIGQEENLGGKESYIYEIAEIVGFSRIQLKQLSAELAQNGSAVMKKALVMDPERRRIMIEHCNTSQYASIAREYLNRSDGMLFYQGMPDDKEWTPFEPPDDEDVLSTIINSLRTH